MGAGFVRAGFTPAPKEEISCLIIPTGIGATIGGYAGDANPIAKLIASKSKYLITHPNVVNGAVLTDIPENIIYLEGFLLDQFLLGKFSLIPNKKNKIGVIFDSGINDERLNYEINVLNALRAFYGCEIKYWTLTDKPLEVSVEINEHGFSTGKIKNIESLIKKALMLKEKGITAIAICSAIPDYDLNTNYKLGKGVDPIGGVEAIISHIVSASTGLVAAHAPVLLSNEEINYKNISPLSASEYIAKTFLPSVISGLRYAPTISSYQLSALDLSQIIVPYNAFGSAGVLYQAEKFKNVTLIKENKTCLEVSPFDLNLKFNIVESYTDLTSQEKVIKLGIDPKVLKRPIRKIERI
ncbi:MAG: DUF3326 domain-containing protein [Candidatus Melainabacteria bacterium]|nr:DUF3326 domain-containing protein [Candidatus Melainabacteria bacterium]